VFNFIASCSNVPLLGPLIDFIATIFGYVMSGIYWIFSQIGVFNIGLCIIVFTIIIKLAMSPLTFKQQKFSKISAAIAPEIQAIQKKYKGKKDNESMAKQQAESKEVYAKYGTSQTGGCLQLVIQMPILFAMYQVIRSIPTYISSVHATYLDIANHLSNNYITNVLGATGTTPAEVTANVIKKLAAFNPTHWNSLIEAAGHSNFAEIISKNYDKIVHVNTFLGMNLGETPWAMMKAGIIWAVFLPLLSGGAQFISTKLTPMNQPVAGGEESQMASSMRTMNFIMPLMSIFFTLSLPAALGLYWMMSSICQVVAQLIINRHFNNEGIDVLIAKSVARQNKKRARKGIPAKTVTSAATKSTKSLVVDNKANSNKTAQAPKGNVKPGSLAEKAGRATQSNNNKTK